MLTCSASIRIMISLVRFCAYNRYVSGTVQHTLTMTIDTMWHCRRPATSYRGVRGVGRDWSSAAKRRSHVARKHFGDAPRSTGPLSVALVNVIIATVGLVH
jgi:hypothetical protein